MSKTVRITALLLILLTVAVSAWKARVRTTEWTETLRVAVYPVSGDDSPVVDAYIAALKRPLERCNIGIHHRTVVAADRIDRHPQRFRPFGGAHPRLPRADSNREQDQ